MNLQSVFEKLTLFIAVGVTGVALNIWQIHFSFSLSDEGYLWYGVQRVLQGDVPLRDFESYDPGRYYLTAAIAGLFGEARLTSIRWIMVGHQILVVFGATLLILSLRYKPDVVSVCLAAVAVFICTVPYFKMPDYLACMLLLGGLTHLASARSARAYAIAGLCVGVAAVLGRNHGVYGVVGSLFVMLWIRMQPDPGRAGLIRELAWAAGVCVGYLPVLLLDVMVHGFALALWTTVDLMIRYGATNLALPVPWPDPMNMNFSARSLREFVGGVLFEGLLLFGVLAIVSVTWRSYRRQPVPPALVACAALGLPYAHYAFSRADPVHLALGSLPFVVGVSIFLQSIPRRFGTPLLAVFVGMLLITFAPFQLAFDCKRNNRCVEADVAGEHFLVDRGTERDLHLLQSLALTYSPGEASFLAAPSWPGAYAVLKAKAPMWEIYPLLPRSAELQMSEIEQLKRAAPRFAVIANIRLDDREDTLLRNTNPLIYNYIVENFDRFPDRSFPCFEVYVAKWVDRSADQSSQGLEPESSAPLVDPVNAKGCAGPA